MSYPKRLNDPSRVLAYLPLWCWLTAFLVMWACAAPLLPYWNEIRAAGKLHAAEIARAWLGAVAPVGSGTLILPMMMPGGEISPHVFRSFNFLVQAVALASGMTYVLCRRMTIDWALAGFAALGGVIGTPLGLIFVAPHISSALTIAIYAIVWGSFGLAALLWLRDRPPAAFPPPRPSQLLKWIALGCGLLGGGTIASVLGAGSSLPLYAVLVFLRRLDVRNAAATCTVVSAGSAFAGAATLLWQKSVEPEVSQLWLAAAPAACLAVPLVWMVVNRIKPQATLAVVAIYCTGQALWLIWQTHDQWPTVGLVYMAGAALYSVFMYRILHLIGVAIGQASPTTQGS